MNKNNLKILKKSLLALGMTGVLVSTTGCLKVDENKVPEYIPLQSESFIEDYYKYIIQNDEAIKVYKSENVYLQFNKETYEPLEFICDKKTSPLGLYGRMMVYNLVNEDLIFDKDSFSYSNLNEGYINYITSNSYEVCLADIEDYIENYVGKDYYSLEEIRNLEPEITKSLKKINKIKTLSL